MAGKQWQAIDSHGARRLDELFKAEPDRLSRLSFEVAGIYFDWSKTHLDGELIDAFVALSEKKGIRGRARGPVLGRDRQSERRPGGRTCRRAGNGAPEAVDLANARRQRMRALIDAIEGGAFGDVTGVLHIGIGGSVLGPALLVDALGPSGRRLQGPVPVQHRWRGVRRGGRRPRPGDDADRGRFQDLHDNRDAGQHGRGAALAERGRSRGPARAADRGHRQARSGGRGRDRRDPHPAVRAGRRRALLAVELGRGLRPRSRSAGTCSRSCSRAPRRWTAIFASPKRPRICRWSRRSPTGCTCSRGCQTRAVFAYDERLRLLPDYLQQLEMESNGKSVTADGKPLDQASAPVTWGGTGTDAQHAVFQLLHQGTVTVPVEFVAVAESEHSQADEHHRLLLLNAFAQGAALMQGRASDDPQRSYAGDRPSATILLERLDARVAGRADRLLRAPHLRQCGAARDQPVRPVRGRAGQGNRARARRGRGLGGARPLDPRADRKGGGLMADFDLFVIGAGSGGVRAARVAAAHGAKVAIAEEYRVGGTCVIRGCVPKKLLVYGAHFAEDLDDAAMFGWDVPQKRFDWPVLRDNVLAEVARLEGVLHRDADQPRRRRSCTSAPCSPGPNSVKLASGQDGQRRQDPDRHRRPAADARRPGHRAWDHLQRGVPSRASAEADRDRRRRLYRQRVRRHLPPVRLPGDAGQPHRRDAAPL